MRKVAVHMVISRAVLWIALVLLLTEKPADASDTEQSVRLAVFDVDATPPMGSAMAYDPVKRVDDLTLRARGLVLLGKDEPIVLCAVDWIGIANEGHDAFRSAIAEAAGTKFSRVAVHTLHQHDAPGCDFTAERLVRELGVEGYTRFHGDFHRIVIVRIADAIREGMANTRRVTHVSSGTAAVNDVASQKRIVGSDGKVKATRTSSTKSASVRSEPEGTIDPMVSLLAFWDGEKPLAILTSYACHPQSYYRLGIPSPDFPGIARFIRGQDVNGALHVHFNGAGGNITAGKYNDGNQANRMILATRLADGMRIAFETSVRKAIQPSDISWRTRPVKLPIAKHLEESDLIAKIKASDAKGYVSFADQLAWLHRVREGRSTDLACLALANNRFLFMPGELFVEYQLASKEMRPDLNVMMAAYGDYGPAYIGTAVAYEQGGYETSPTASNVAPEVEPVLMEGIKQLLSDPLVPQLELKP
jgi:hypothetical protein